MPSSRRSARRPYHGGHIPLDLQRARGGTRVELADDGEWTVRQVVSEKPYHCPGCNQVVPANLGHLVTWRRDSWQGEAAGLDQRRHWHNSCWQRR